MELSVSPEERARGLQFRTCLPKDYGMLFVFSEEQHVTFWMKDTPMPLSIAFVTREGIIAQIDDMKPLSLSAHTSKTRVQYALEMENGWFKKNSVPVGAVVQIPRGLLER